MASIGANGSRGHHRFTLNVNETSTSTANNTSTVSWSLVLSPITTGYDWNYSSTVPVTYSININGAVYTGNIMSYNGSATVTVRSGSQTVAHNNDGTKSIGFSFSVSSINKSYLPGSASANGSMNLTTILRQAFITNAPNFNDEDNPTITYSNPLGNSVTTLQACISLTGNTDDIAYRDISKTGTSYTFELTETERNILRNATTSNSRNVIFHVKTVYGGNTYYSTATKTFSIINGNPIFEDFTYQDTNATITEITDNDQVLVKGLSTLQVAISSANKMEAIKGATEKNYVATIDTTNQNVNYSDNDLIINLGTVNAIGTQRLNVRAYDSRNNSTLVYKDVIVYDYTAPAITFSAERLNNFEAQTTLKVSGSFASLLIDNVEKNDIQSVQYRYQEIGSDTWSNWANITYVTSGNAFTCPDTIVALDNTKEFIIEVKVVDNLSNNSVTATIDVGEAIFFISSNEKKCYINDYEIATFNRVYPIGSIYMNINNTNPNELFGIGTWEQIEGRFLLGASESHVAGTIGGKEKVTLSAAIGSYNNSINTLGFVSASASAYQLNHNPTYIVAGGNDNPINMGNHSTVVTEHNVNDRDVTIMPPYLAVYIWKRTA